eukprot:scaffold112236_cov21-Tisochrysis_lutea.AAC.1
MCLCAQGSSRGQAGQGEAGAHGAIGPNEGRPGGACNPSTWQKKGGAVSIYESQACRAKCLHVVGRPTRVTLKSIVCARPRPQLTIPGISRSCSNFLPFSMLTGNQAAEAANT